MGNLRRHLLVAAGATLAACGGNDNKPDALIIIPDAAIDAPPPIDAPPDAPSYDFSCAGNSAPTTAPAQLMVSGSAYDLNPINLNPVPVADAQVEAFRVGNANAIATTTTDAAGAWSVSLTSGGAPVDGYIRARKQGHRTTLLYPPAPLHADLAMAPLLALSNTTFAGLNVAVGGNQMAGNGVVLVAAVDCANNPVDGAMIRVQQSGSDVGNQVDLSQVQGGVVFVFNVPPGATEVSATYNGMAFRAHTVQSLADGTTMTVVSPGF
ncbi:MAG: hypothetical protein ACTHU0_29880 [Kofleriaceae bacterium]